MYESHIATPSLIFKVTLSAMSIQSVSIDDSMILSLKNSALLPDDIRSITSAISWKHGVLISCHSQTPHLWRVRTVMIRFLLKRFWIFISGAGAYHFFMNRTQSVQIQSERLGGRSGSMITGWNVHIFEHDFFKATWYLCLPETKISVILTNIHLFKWQSLLTCYLNHCILRFNIDPERRDLYLLLSGETECQWSVGFISCFSTNDLRDHFNIIDHFDIPMNTPYD